MEVEVHVLGDALSRIPQFTGSESSALNNLTKKEVIFNAPGSINEIRKVDKPFNSLYLALNGTFPKCPVQSERIRLLFPSFKLKNDFPIYEDKICIPCSKVKEILEISHGSKISGDFPNTKTLSLHGRLH